MRRYKQKPTNVNKLNGSYPLLFWAEIDAPFLIKNAAISKCPLEQQTWSGVWFWRVCAKNKKIYIKYH